MKLNIAGTEARDGGPSSPLLEGFTNVDIREIPGVDVVADVRALPFKVGTIEEIRASHIIEHLHSDDIQKTVNHWASLLKKGGLLRIYAPNARRLAEDLVTSTLTIEEFSRQMFGNQSYVGNLHLVAVDQERLERWVLNAGLTLVGAKPRPQAYIYDLGVQATKVE